MTKDQWIKLFIAPRGGAEEEGARAYLDWIDELGGVTEIAEPSHGSIKAVFSDRTQRPVCAFRLMWHSGARAAYVELQFESLKLRRGLASEDSRRRHYQGFSEVVPLSNRNLGGRPNFAVALLADPRVRAALTPVARRYIASAMEV